MNELQEIGRIEAGKVTLAIEPVDVRSAVEEVLALVAPLAEERACKSSTASAPNCGLESS